MISRKNSTLMSARKFYLLKRGDVWEKRRYGNSDSKELGMLTLNVEHNYICFHYKDFKTTTCFGPICGPSSGCGCVIQIHFVS